MLADGTPAFTMLYIIMVLIFTKLLVLQKKSYVSLPKLQQNANTLLDRTSALFDCYRRTVSCLCYLLCNSSMWLRQAFVKLWSQTCSRSKIKQPAALLTRSHQVYKIWNYLEMARTLYAMIVVTLKYFVLPQAPLRGFVAHVPVTYLR